MRWKLDEMEARKWQHASLCVAWERLLYEPGMLDIDTTVKTVFGHQEGGEVGYNSHKPRKSIRTTDFTEGMD